MANMADQLGVPFHSDYRKLLDRGVEGVIVARRTIYISKLGRSSLARESTSSLGIIAATATSSQRGWRSPLHARQIDVVHNDPYVDQMAHFACVVRGLETPRVSGHEGLRSLAVVTAVIEAARTGEVVDVEELLSRLPALPADRSGGLEAHENLVEGGD